MCRTAIEASPGKKFSELQSQSIAGYSGTLLSFQAMWETEIGSIAILGQPGQKGLQDPISLENNRLSNFPNFSSLRNKFCNI
jgi:hypothetical protein